MFIIDDIIGGIFGSFNNMMTNSNNYDIATMNMNMQHQTNEANKNMVRETNAANKKNVEATNKANQQIASAYNANQVQLQNDMNAFNKDMWNLNNAYNSPAQQIERARAAGINPNVVFGQPVAASPVQQTSIPQQQMAQMQPYIQQSSKDVAPRNDMKYQSSFLEQLGKGLSSLGKLPFVKEQLDMLKEGVRGLRADNEAKEYDLQGRKDADAFYGGNAYYTATDGTDRILTQDEFDRLSDNEKTAFLDRETPYVTINGERKPNYNASQLPFRNKATFEAYKEVQALPNFFQNVRADRVQNELREYVAKYQIKEKDANGRPSVIYALAHMPETQYNNLVESYHKLLNENNWNAEDRELDKKILNLQFEQLDRASKHDFFTYIDKIGDGDMTTADYFKMFLVGLHDILAGASQFVRKR